MRRAVVSRHRSRSRSRSPVLRGPRSVVSKAMPINMLDPSAVQVARHGANSRQSDGFKAPHRITCTIEGEARRKSAPGGRMESYGYVDRGRKDDQDRRPFGSGGRLEGRFRRGGMDMGNRQGGRHSFGTARERESVAGRLSFGGNSRNDGRAATDRRSRYEDDDEYDERKNGSFREERLEDGSLKPVQRLIDPAQVPKGRGYFDHDDRGAVGDVKWRGRTAYDPRIDFGPRRGRPSTGWDGFQRSTGRFENRDRRSGDYDRNRDVRRSFGGSGRSAKWPSSAADSASVWTHDKFNELEDEDDIGRGGIEVIVDQSQNRRIVHDEDDVADD